MLQWTEQYATGSSNLDIQHQTLFDNLNSLEQLLAREPLTAADHAFIRHTIGFLEHYADKHFKCEEQCMEDFRCPARDHNRQMHAEFLRLFHEFKAFDHATGFPHDIVVRLHTAMHDWITDHILQVDVQLRPVIKG